MRNEPKMMKEIHDIRARNHSSEIGLSMQELKIKRNNEILETEKIITEYGLNILPVNNLKRPAI
jgi:hypothetical protein